MSLPASVRCALARGYFLDGVSADRHHPLHYSMETVQPRSRGHSHLLFPQCEVWSVKMSHGELLSGMCVCVSGQFMTPSPNLGGRK